MLRILRLHQAIDGLSGAICVAGDIVVYGCGGDKDTITKDNDVKLDVVFVKMPELRNCAE